MLISRLPPHFFFFNDTATTEIYTLSLHDALPISSWSHPPSACRRCWRCCCCRRSQRRHDRQPICPFQFPRSEEHTSELQSPDHLVCRLLLEKKKNRHTSTTVGYDYPIRHTSDYEV